MPVIPVTASGGVKLDPGTYEVTVIETVEEVIPQEKRLYGGDGHMLKLKLGVNDVVNEDGSDIELTASASYKLSPSTKLWSWVEAFGFKLEVGQSFDTDQLIGMSCQALITQDKKDDGSVWAKVDQLFPLGRKAAPALQVIRDDGSVNWIAFWKSMDTAGVSRQNVADSLGVDMEGLTKHLASMSKEDVVDLLASSGASA